MDTYLRILRFAKPYYKLFPRYMLFLILATLFGLVNFTMLIPLFDVLFEQVDRQPMTAFPEFSLSVDYVKQVFYFYFYQIIESRGKMGALLFVAALIIASVLLTNVFRYLAGITMAVVRAGVVSRLRNTLFDHVTSLHLGHFTASRKGDVMSRITNDVQEVERTIINSIKVLFKEPLAIIGYFAVLFIMSAQLTVFTIFFMPVAGGIISEITKRLKKKARLSQDSLGSMVNILDEVLGGIRIVKAFNAEGYVNKTFSRESNRYRNILISMARRQELASPASETLGVMAVAGILLYGGSLVLNNDSSLEASEFIAYLIIFSQILTPAKQISNAISNIQRGLAAGERIFHTLDTTPAVKDTPDAVELKTFTSEIRFESVSFSYDEEEVLHDISFSLKKGQSVALVGPSGSGKSTLADLLPRFYEPTRGTILLDGQPLAEYKITDLRRQMGIVTQESILFNDTVFNNIAFGMPEASLNQVKKAAEIANASNFIEELPHGYDTNIGERGMKLSGGQRQRMSIARAVLKNPPILILDEATSALDSESEHLVQEALAQLMKNRTSLVIAHRLSTIQHADVILVIQNGRILQRGTHYDLLEQEGLYRKMTEIQSL